MKRYEQAWDVRILWLAVLERKEKRSRLRKAPEEEWVVHVEAQWA